MNTQDQSADELAMAVVNILVKEGWTTEKLATASAKDITAIPGVGEYLAKTVIGFFRKDISENSE